VQTPAGTARGALVSATLVLGRQRSCLTWAQYKVPAALQLLHVAVFGPTGSGKSTQLVNLASQNATFAHRPGCLVVDLKDTLADDVALRLPPHRESDVLFFDLADRQFPPAFNPLANVPEESRTLAASELVSAFKRLWGDSWGPRIEHVLRNAALTLLETPDATLLDIIRLLTDEAYRTWASRRVSNFSVQHFWEREFGSIVGTRGSVANVESILNKLSILSYPEIRNVLGQTRRGLDVGRAMQDGKLLLAHVPQGVLGEDASSFIASLLVAHVQLAAQRRVRLPPAQRRPFLLFADECQNYDISSFQKLITEGRSMGVGVIAACQFEEQLSLALRQTIAHNCVLKLVCSAATGTHTVEVIYLQRDPKPAVPLVLQAVPAARRPNPEQVQFMRARSRTVLARPRAEVEADIRARMTQNHAAGGRERQQQKEQSDGRRSRFFE
jgi:DNA helicase HerA-like ATPase